MQIVRALRLRSFRRNGCSAFAFAFASSPVWLPYVSSRSGLHCSLSPTADEHFGTLLGVLAGSAEIEDCTCAGSESAQLLSVLRPVVLQQLIPKVDRRSQHSSAASLILLS